MTEPTGATLRIFDNADREILKMSRTEKGAVWDFQHKFRHNPRSPGLRLKPLKGDSRLWSARVNDDYRAILLHIKDQDYLLVSVQHRSKVYDNLDRFSYQINKITGGIEVYDLATVAAAASAQPADPAEEPSGLFASFADQQLIDLGVPPMLLPSIARITDDEQLLQFTECVPQLAADVLLALYDGKSVEEVAQQITAPVTTDDHVDQTDFVAALHRPATLATTDDEALQAILAKPFARWQVFLHPTQRKLASSPRSGASRVSGGPGTGKTIVALHRVQYLAEQLSPGTSTPILLTTYNRNLAADLRARLLDLCGPELMKRVDIVNVDSLASRVAAENRVTAGLRIIEDEAALKEWEKLLIELGDKTFTAEFLHSEWTSVILGHALTSRAEYFKVRRPGRGRSLKREERAAVWGLVERYVERLEQQRSWTRRQVCAAAARAELDRAEKIAAAQYDSTTGLQYRYRHIVVDEAQDLSAAHWTMLRAMAPVGENDMFLVGDPHQRLYDNYVTLSSLGINIRGRSAKLTLSYRTTREILATATGLLTGEQYDDLDGGADDLLGYRSILRGDRPDMRGFDTWSQEREFIRGQLEKWHTDEDANTAVSLPTRQMVDELVETLSAAGIPTVKIGADGPGRAVGVHVGTMHRFKGLEYQRIVIGGVTAGLVPRSGIRKFQDSDPRRYERERARERSRLFVAATRARDTLVITWHGVPSEFMPTDTSTSQDISVTNV